VHRTGGTGLLASVVIVSYGDHLALRTCLDLIRKCTSVPHEVVVAGNFQRGPREAAPRAASMSNRVWVESRGPRTRIINQGILRSKGEYVSVLSAGALVTPGWLDRMILCFERNAGAGVVLPGRGADLCMLTKRGVISEVGLWDERMETGQHADADYFMRVLQSGQRVVRSKETFVFPYERRRRKPSGTGVEPQTKSHDAFVGKWCGNIVDFWDDLDAVFQTD